MKKNIILLSLAMESAVAVGQTHSPRVNPFLKVVAADGDTGIMTIEDLLEVKDQSVVNFGEDRLAEIVQREVDVHNELVNEMSMELVEMTTERKDRTGGTTDGIMMEVSETANAPTQNVLDTGYVEYPMKKYQFNLGWTAQFFRRATPRDIALMVMSSEKAHIMTNLLEIKKALFVPTNYSVRDLLVDKVTLNVKRLYNADGTLIPSGPSGASFDGSTHTHYLAYTSLTTTAADALINTVLEHTANGRIIIEIAKGDEAAWRALSGFAPYLDARLTLRMDRNEAIPTLDTSRTDNRAIGIYNGAEVQVKPWIMTGYCWAYDANATEKPLKRREPKEADLRGLRIVADLPDYPLYAKVMEAEFGYGAYNRGAAAVMQFNAAVGGVYEVPTITS